MNLRDPGQAGLALVGALMVLAAPLCVSMAAIQAGMPLAALAFPVLVVIGGAGVARLARHRPSR